MRLSVVNNRRALELLAASPDGATEAILVAHGFTIDLLVELVRAGLATAKAERVMAGGRSMEVARVRITDEGRRILVHLRRRRRRSQGLFDQVCDERRQRAEIQFAWLIRAVFYELK
jgi:hypothetical protein